ncbi:ABC-type transport system, involved in lipoprotein release, permease component [Thermus oshimai JL-2]|uniref:ABC-type transport system, involved in lipoprotein release, permease component n=1 Tax=Thermus oshimai JL-2 TaxID=751945 RepID=K7QWP5_THEOS|nr:FtsX-like permease family protein [Thermus oshimai]AFV76018.1 ABC-type transport system, involved in lipoprotein release, permease component [Thermus oshimai JL-2]
MFRLAWRNLLRTPGRSLTTLGVVALVVFLSLLFLSVYAGAFDAFLRLILERTGHLVVRVEGYREKEDLEGLAFTPPPLDLPPGATLEGALEGAALLIAGERSRAVSLTGLEPEAFRREKRALSAGRLPEAPGEALLGEALARALRVGLGDEVVAYAPGGLGLGVYPFRVVGLLDLPETQLEARTLLVPLEDAQLLLAPGRVTLLRVWLPGVGLYEMAPLEALKGELSPRLPGLSVETWLEANPLYAALLPLYDVVMGVYVGIFFALAGLILLNALYLSLVERIREFGLLAALGLTGRRVMALVLWESLLLVGVGAGVGLLLGLGVHLTLADGFRLPLPQALLEQYREFGLPEVLYGRLSPKDLLLTLGYAVGVAVLAALWPAYLASRLEPVEAMRYVP